MKRLVLSLLIMIVVFSGCKSVNTVSNTDINYNMSEEQKNQVVQDDSNKMKDIDQNTSNTNNATETNYQLNEKPVVLFHGSTLDSEDQKVDLLSETDDMLKKKILTKYDREYYLYSNGEFLGKAKGEIVEEEYPYGWAVTFTPINDKSEVAISQSYNPYPRKLLYSNSNFQKEFHDDSQVLSEINNQFGVSVKTEELCCIDLDGDVKNEYLVLVADEEKYFFAKCLLDSDFKIISYLTVYNEEKEFYYKDFKYYFANFLDTCEVIDINNDGIMEIIMRQPLIEGLVFNVFRYQKGIFDGDYMNDFSLKL